MSILCTWANFYPKGLKYICFFILTCWNFDNMMRIVNAGNKMSVYWNLIWLQIFLNGKRSTKRSKTKIVCSLSCIPMHAVMKELSWWEFGQFWSRREVWFSSWKINHHHSFNILSDIFQWVVPYLNIFKTYYIFRAVAQNRGK